MCLAWLRGCGSRSYGALLSQELLAAEDSIAGFDGWARTRTQGAQVIVIRRLAAGDAKNTENIDMRAVTAVSDGFYCSARSDLWADRRDSGLRRLDRGAWCMESNDPHQLYAYRSDDPGLPRRHHPQQLGQRRGRMGLWRDAVV